MSKIAFISFNTGGTLGHTTLLSKLAMNLINEHEVYILSDHDFSINSAVRNPRVTWEKFPQEITVNSNGGRISYRSSERFLKYCSTRNIDYVIYSTFFDSKLVKELDKNKVKNIYVSYPLRDAYSELFFLRKHNDIFNHVIILRDLYDNKYPESVKRTNPLLLPHQKQESNSQKILLTCGGGGRPSSVRFLQLMKDYVPAIKRISDVEITLIRGPNNKEIEIDDVMVLESTSNMQRYIDEAKVVISEAGYFTTHELISRSKPSILIPGERRIDNQELRAIKYEERGLGFCVMPSEDIELLVSKTFHLLTDQERYRQIQANCQTYYSQYKPEENIENILRGLIR
ncbi:MAG: hypothetical protein KKF46_00960 [Nanoarchaeota archaeon]|nr:hypothetical protein [Nanoarchaeota archaeon]MBU1320904.1 hypothetical protein [Nanoarchaeota archaeon]MBU1597571.1 hypothetical protein [Nanoarchaeota archaeon]MBU2441514.1 hypothetical protein [Nanoarchaeota archaeon]